MIAGRRIPAGYEVHSPSESWSVYFYRRPFVGWNGRRVVFRWRGRVR